MQETKGSVTVQKDGYKEENMLFTYSEEEQEENKINRENAQRVFSPEFIPYYPGVANKFELCPVEALLYGFIRFYMTNANTGGRFYFTDEQLATILNSSERTISRAMKRLKDLKLITTSRAIKAGGGSMRFIRSVSSGDSEPPPVASQNRQNGGEIDNKINKNKINIYDCSFETFWTQYPKKVAKKKVEALYKRLCTSQDKENALLKGLQLYVNKWRVEKTDIKYIPNPLTWLNQERWEDDVVISNEPFVKNSREHESKWREVKRIEKEQYLTDGGNGELGSLSELLDSYKDSLGGKKGPISNSPPEVLVDDGEVLIDDGNGNPVKVSEIIIRE